MMIEDKSKSLNDAIEKIEEILYRIGIRNSELNLLQPLELFNCLTIIAKEISGEMVKFQREIKGRLYSIDRQIEELSHANASRDGDLDIGEKVLKAAQLTHEIFDILGRIAWDPGEKGVNATVPYYTQHDVKKRYEEIGKLLGRELKW